MSFASWTWEGGRWTRCEGVPLSDRGFRYGMSVFETLRLLDGVPLFFEEHSERLAAACGACGFAIPPEALPAARKPLRSESINGVARLYVTAGDGPVSTEPGTSRLFLFVEKREHGAGQPSWRLAIHPEPHPVLFPGLKTANYWSNLHALRTAKAEGCDEALLFGPCGLLISACCANVFVVVDGAIKTPQGDLGARAGVIRQWVVERRPGEEADITMDLLCDAEEVFLTSSWIGIASVGWVGERTMRSNAVAARLQEEYEVAIRTPARP